VILNTVLPSDKSVSRTGLFILSYKAAVVFSFIRDIITGAIVLIRFVFAF
jgi:hypothetical protein